MSNLNQLDIEDSRETLDILFEMNQVLNCGLSKETLNILITMIEQGVNPEALIRVVEELRKFNYSEQGGKSEIFRTKPLKIEFICDIFRS